MVVLNIRRVLAPVMLMAAVVSVGGCGNLTDKDLIVIAEVEGEPIRRGDLRRLIRDMDDDERPIIYNRADLLRVLNQHIDNLILDDAAYELRSEGKIEVPREQARAVYFRKNPDDRVIYEVQTAEELQQADLDVSEGQLAAFKADIDFQVDDVEEELYRQAALNYLIQEAVDSGRLTITDQEYQQEYEIYKNRLRTLERVGFVGVRFDAHVPNAAEKAAECRRLYDEHGNFDQLLAAYHRINPELVFQSMIENNPSLARFKGVWDKLTGASVGDVFGPLYLPAHDVMEQLPDGSYRSVRQPDAYVVIRVTVYEPPKAKDWQEARADLAPLILRRKMIRQLRADHGVQVYEDKLPDPSRYDREERGVFVDVE